MDAMSMSRSLEVRSPFTDYEVVSAAWQIDASIRCAGVPDKPFEKAAYGSILMPHHHARRKQGFNLPFDTFFRSGAIAAELQETLRDPLAVARAGLRPEAVDRLANRYFSGSTQVPWSRLWSLFALIRWCGVQGVSP
jgi:asparagine synthase (glutamine-hydrolysing)